MFNKRLDHIIGSIETLKPRTVFLILGMVSIFIRLPFFFRDYIDRDESTFILMGQSWVNGHLPYTELWDLKPPLVFLFFASIIYLFGKSFIAIRLAGALVVAVIAFCTYLTGREVHSKQLGFWASVGCIYLLSLFGSLQGVMSEHLSMLFFMPALYLLISKRGVLFALAAGLLMGMAAMTKINLAYAIVIAGIFLLYHGYRDKEFKNGIKMTVLFGTGILLVIFLTWLPYYLSDQSMLWWNSVVMAPLEYTEAREFSLFKMAPIILLTLAFFYFGYQKKWLPLKEPGIQLLSVVVLGVVLSFVKGGRVNGHYLIQFHPTFLVLFGIFVSKALPPLSRRLRPLLLLLLLLPVETYKEYVDVVLYRMERGTFFNGEGFTVPAYLKDHNLDHKKILFLEYHIGYWMLDISPPTKPATHPTNLCRDELFKYYGNPRENSMQELAYLMDVLKPEIVITRYQRRIFEKKKEEENAFMVEYLKNHYKVIDLVDRAEIHQRLN